MAKRFSLEKEEREIDLEFIDIKASRIRRILRLVRLAAAVAFTKQYKEIDGFEYHLRAGQNQIDEDNTIMEIDSVVEGKNSISFNYTFTCDNSSPLYSDLYYRTPRADYINNMIAYINSSRIHTLKRTLNISDIKLKTQDGGKNPTLYIQSIWTWKEPDKKKPGRIVERSMRFNFNFSIKYAGNSADASKLASLKPSHIEPKIVGIWLSPKDFYDNVISYIDGAQFPTANIILKQKYKEAVQDSYRTDSYTDRLGIAPDISSEFFEVLSVLKISKLLSNNNRQILDICGWPAGERINNVQVRIPTAANEALTDYEVKINHSRILKISVKSKVRGSSSATVKFSTAFSDERKVTDWFKTIASSAKSHQIGQLSIASAALKYHGYSGKGTMYPIRALKTLLKSSKKTYVANDMNNIMNMKSMNVNNFYKLVDLLDRKMPSISKNYTPLDDILKNDGTLLAQSKNLIADNLFKNSSGGDAKTKKLQSIVGATYEEAKRKSPNGQYPFSLNNIALICERVLVRTSQRDGSSGFNFYKMFYDQVLLKNEIIYSVTKREERNGEERLKYEFISAQNFAQYKDWVELRSKNYANNMQDTLGMAV
jgi:hypothetical protein